MEKARKIRGEREFKTELADIGVLGAPAQTRGSAKAAKAASPHSGSDNDDGGNDNEDSSMSLESKKAQAKQDNEDGSDEEGYTGPQARKSTEAAQRRRKSSYLAAFAAELNSSDAE